MFSPVIFSCSYPEFDLDEGYIFDVFDVDTFSIYYPSSLQEYLMNLKANYTLEVKISSCKSDMQRVQVISHWVHELWIHHQKNIPGNNDPVSIIKAAQNGERFRCVEYSIVLAGCLNALGFPARVVGLTTPGNEESHVSSEVYLWDLKKWIMADGQWDVIPVVDNIPLNIFELREALMRKDNDLSLTSLSCVDKWNFCYWIAPYLCHFTYYLNNEAFWKTDMIQEYLILEPANSSYILQLHKNEYRTSNPFAPYKVPQLKN